MNTKLLLIIVSLLLAANGFAQRTDTVESRSLTSNIGDSTSIRYHLGSFCLQESGDKRFLHFQNRLHRSSLSYYQTQDFTITNANTSLSMFRFARFDGNASLLNATSTILYIVDICNSATDSVLLRIDTLACYVDAKGKLGYTCYPTSNEYPHCDLNDIRVGTKVYARLERIAMLPPGVTIKDEMDAPLILNYPPSEHESGFVNSETEFGNSGDFVVQSLSEPINKKQVSYATLHATNPHFGKIDITPEIFIDWSSVGISRVETLSYPHLTRPIFGLRFSADKAGVVNVSCTHVLKPSYGELFSHTVSINGQLVNARIVDTGDVRIVFVADTTKFYSKNRDLRLTITTDTDYYHPETYKKVVLAYDPSLRRESLDEEYINSIGTPALVRPISIGDQSLNYPNKTPYPGEKMFEALEQIGAGDNLLLLSSHRLPRGDYDIVVKMGNEILYKSRRRVY